MDFVAILGTGVSGFAFLMLCIGYRLTAEVQRQILAADLTEMSDRQAAFWSELADKQLANTRYFMGFTSLFLVLGLTMLAYRPQSQIVLSLSPYAEHLPTIYAQEDQVELDDNGRGRVTVRSDHQIFIENHAVFEALAKLRTDFAATRASERSLAARLAATSNDAGFGRLLSEP